MILRVFFFFFSFLTGIGVGDEKATSLAATITWLLRHGAGMIGSILFTWMQGSDLDYNCKKWRLFADIANDAAMCLELSGPFWPSEFFQYILCLASVSRALVGVAGGATRTAITQHQGDFTSFFKKFLKEYIHTFFYFTIFF